VEYNTQNHWVSVLCPSSGILNNWKTQRVGNSICFHPQVSGGIHLLCLVPQKGLTSITGPVSVFFHSPEEGNRSSLGNVFSSYLEYQTMGKIHRPSDSGCLQQLAVLCTALCRECPFMAETLFNEKSP
jgi:hypothetical protein